MFGNILWNSEQKKIAVEKMFKMGSSNWNVWSLISVFVLLLSLSYLCEARIGKI